MSADRWSICPKCAKNDKESVAKAEKILKEAYGKVPVEEYLRLKAEHEAPRQLEETFREDYSFHLNHETRCLEIEYYGGCSECEFTIKHKSSQPF